jgi:iodotyrosine deiodinase
MTDRLDTDPSDFSVNGEFRPVPLPYVRPDPAEALAASEAFLGMMSTRRSVRQFSLEPVPFELIVNAVATASSAPSGAHMQPWTFVVVADPEIKAQIRAAAEAEERKGYGGRLGEEWLTALRRLGTDWHKPHITDAPYVIVVFEQAYGLDAAGVRHKHYYVKESVGIACGLLLASLHMAGLATLTHTPSPMGFLGKILKRPRNERPYLLIPVGYPAPDAVVPELTRKPLSKVMQVVGDPPPTSA